MLKFKDILKESTNINSLFKTVKVKYPNSNFINQTIQLRGKNGLIQIHFKKEDNEFMIDYNKNTEYFDNEKDILKFINKNTK